MKEADLYLQNIILPAILSVRDEVVSALMKKLELRIARKEVVQLLKNRLEQIATSGNPGNNP